MRNIAINCLSLSSEVVQFLSSIQAQYNLNISCLNDKIHQELRAHNILVQENNYNKLDFVLSLGGDGTLLDTAYNIGNKEIPILGINFGRLGFLADIKASEKDKIDNLFNNIDCEIDERSLIEVISPSKIMGDKNFAVNECAIYKKESQSLLTLHTFVDGNFLSSFWADGLLIATPTGSTAYSLSIGGPILSPSSKNFIINPIAPHHLTVRPVVIDDCKEIKIIVEGRDDYYNMSLDSRCVQIKDQTEIILKKTNFNLKLLKYKHDNFFTTLRTKLMWGADIRN